MAETATTKPRPPRLMKRADIEKFLTAISGDNLDPKTELDYGSPYQLLVALVLSAQTTDAAVNKVTKVLYAAAPDPIAMAALGEAGIGEKIRSIGLWQVRARNVAG